MAEAFAEEDLSIPEDVPSADDPSSRANPRDLESAGFSLDEFAALLSKYDYNSSLATSSTAPFLPWSRRAR